MARRAGLYTTYRNSGKPFLSIAGPYEFLADDPFSYGIYADQFAPPEDKDKQGERFPPAEEARIELAAYSLLNVNLGWISPKSARWLRANTGKLPNAFIAVEKQPVVRLLKSPLGMVGVVLFPEGPVPGKGPTTRQEEAVLQAGRELDKKAVLVVGVSPWGYVGERDFLPKAQGVFSCLFGGGEGVALAHALSDKYPGVLWLRPDTQGRAVNILEILLPPALGKTWVENTHFKARLEFLDEEFPADPSMLSIIGKAPKTP